MHLSVIRIATRKSPLALVQAEIVRKKLMTAFPGIIAEIVPMNTTGDDNMNISLADIGGKGLFTKELEEGILSGKLDIAVHSLKDMETKLANGLVIGAVIEREDPRDALIAPKHKTLANLPLEACIGTSSLRRAALLKMMRPDLRIVPFRGNVATRIAKVEKNDAVDATILAVAGLKRLQLESLATELFDTETFIPAVGQGIIAIECQENNSDVRAMLQAIHHGETHYAALCERSMLAAVDGSCRTPIAGYARLEDGRLRIDALVADKNGSKFVKATRTGNAKDAIAIGEAIAEELLTNGGKACLV